MQSQGLTHKVKLGSHMSQSLIVNRPVIDELVGAISTLLRWLHHAASMLESGGHYDEAKTGTKDACFILITPAVQRLSVLSHLRLHPLSLFRR